MGNFGTEYKPSFFVLKIKGMNDKRILYNKCISDYRTAGYKVIVLPGKNKEPCDKCERQGYECIVKRGGVSVK